MTDNVRWFDQISLQDLEQVGGKNASLGEMVANLSSLGVRVPDGFATTADAFRRFIGETGLAERISSDLAGLDTDDVRRLAEVGRSIREAVAAQPFPPDLEEDIRSAYEKLSSGDAERSFAVRSSATAEDLPDASFAGQQETFLNVRGIDAVLHAIREVFASLYNDRAIAYRVHHDFDHDAVALSAGVQQMVRSDVGASGVMFTMDTESGFDRRGLRDLVVRSRRGGRAGCGESRRVLRLQARAARRSACHPQAGRRLEGHQDGLHRRPRRRPHDGVRGHRPGRAAAAQPHRRRGRGAGPPRADDRGALRPAHGHRVGQGRPRRPALRAAGPTRDRAVAGDRRPAALPDGRDRRRRRRGPGHRSADRRRRGAGAADGRADARVRPGRGPGRGHDGPRLGTHHEARVRDRHEPRRPHVPRRHHRPGARHPGGRRHRHRDPAARGRTSGDGVLRRGRHGPRVRRGARLHRRPRPSSSRCPRSPRRS